MTSGRLKMMKIWKMDCLLVKPVGLAEVPAYLRGEEK